MAKFRAIWLGLVLGLSCSSPVLAVTYFPSPAFPALTPNGRPLVGGTVTITNSAGAGVASQIKGDLTGATSYSYTVPANGLVQFFASADTYIVTISASGVTLRWYTTLGAGGGGGGITELNGLTAATQTFNVTATGTGVCDGTNFCIDSTSSVHNFVVPTASATVRGLMSTAAQTFAGNKSFNGWVTSQSDIVAGSDGTGSLILGTGANTPFYSNTAIPVVAFHTSTPDLFSSAWTLAFAPSGTNAALEALNTNTGGTAFKATGGSGIAVDSEGTTGTAVKGRVTGAGRAGFFQRSVASSVPVFAINRNSATDTQPLLHLDDDQFPASAYSLKIDAGTQTSGITPSGQFHGSSSTTLLPIFSALGDENTGFTVTTGVPCIVDEGLPLLCVSGATSPHLTAIGGGLQLDQDYTTFAAKFVRSANGSTEPIVWIQRDEDADAQPMLKFDNVNATPSGNYIWQYDLANTPTAALQIDGTFLASSPINKAAYAAVGADDSGLSLLAAIPCLMHGGTNILCVTSTAPPNVSIVGDVLITGEISVSGVSGTGKAVCVKSDGNFGVCSDTPNGSGVCTCG